MSDGFDASVRIHADTSGSSCSALPPSSFSTRQSPETQVRGLLELDRFLVGRSPPPRPDPRAVLHHEPPRSSGRHGKATGAGECGCRPVDPPWGYRRIQGAIANLGHVLAHTTIANILKRHGIEPAPERNRKTTWKEFLDRHW